MCGVIGFFNFEEATKLVQEGLEILKHRGVDNSSFFDGTTFDKNTNSTNCLGHRLHAINGFNPLPFLKEDKVLSANCEIYNFKELSKELKIPLNDSDSRFLHEYLIRNGVNKESLDLLDGVYAFALWQLNKNVIITRDLLGEKPLWYFFHEKKFAFASEKKVLTKLGLKKEHIQELHPRHILTFNLETKELQTEYKKFFEVPKEEEKDENYLKTTTKLLEDAIIKRIPPNKEVALLFSGGLDSCFIALILKKHNVKFKCYTASLKHETFQDSHDETWSLNAAKALNLDLEIVNTSIREYEEIIRETLNIIEDNNVTKASVGSSFFMCAKKAKKDGFKVIFSGIGSEELFAGYNRHLNSHELNEECLSGFRKLYERDLYRDDAITMYHNLELRNPFLDLELIKYSFKIPSEQKITKEHNKYILRTISKNLGLPEEFAYRKKMAAQYGSNFDKALTKLAKQTRTSKSGFLKKIYNEGNVRLGILWSTGKDSALATQVMIEQNYEIKCLMTINPNNKDSYMYHGPNTHLAKLHSEASNTPLLLHESNKEKEEELDDLKTLLQNAKQKHHIEGVVSGALFSNYQRKRIEQICDELGLKVFAPLWHMNQEKELELLHIKKIDFCLVKIAGEGLNKNWLGRPLTTKDFNELHKLKEKYGLNPAGEGGEFESLVLDTPFFNKKLKLEKTKIIEESEICATMIIEDAQLVEKIKKEE